MTRAKTGNWIWYALAIAAGGLATVVCPAGSFLPDGQEAVAGFVAFLFALTLLVIAIGGSVTGSPFGILQSSRNTYGLSRFQMVVWTVIMIAAIGSIVLWRAWRGTKGDADAFNIPPDCLLVMGISYGTGAAVPGLLALKSQSPSTDDQQQAASDRLGEAVVADGQVVGRPPQSQAVLGDLVKGDDLATAGLVDLSKLQQLIITCGLAAYYIYQVCSLLAQKYAALPGLPAFDEHFVQFLAVSHAGYLTYKAIPQSPPSAAPVVPIRTTAPRPPSPAL